MARGIEWALADCLERIERGEATPEEALRAYPELRAELVPLLALAGELRSARRVVAPYSLRTTRRPVFARHSGAALAASGPPLQRGMLIRPVWARLAPMARLAASITVALMLLGGGMVASASSLPEDPLFPVKLAVEGAQLALAPGPEVRMEMELEFASRRLAEVESAARQGRAAAVERGLALYEEKVERALQAAQALPEPSTPEAGEEDAQRFRDSLERQQQVLVRVANQVPPQAQPAILRAMEASQPDRAPQSKSAMPDPRSASQPQPVRTVPGTATRGVVAPPTSVPPTVGLAVSTSSVATAVPTPVPAAAKGNGRSQGEERERQKPQSSSPIFDWSPFPLPAPSMVPTPPTIALPAPVVVIPTVAPRLTIAAPSPVVAIPTAKERDRDDRDGDGKDRDRRERDGETSRTPVATATPRPAQPTTQPVEEPTLQPAAPTAEQPRRAGDAEDEDEKPRDRGREATPAPWATWLPGWLWREGDRDPGPTASATAVPTATRPTTAPTRAPTMAPQPTQPTERPRREERDDDEGDGDERDDDSRRRPGAVSSATPRASPTREVRATATPEPRTKEAPVAPQLVPRLPVPVPVPAPRATGTAAPAAPATATPAPRPTERPARAGGSVLWPSFGADSMVPAPRVAPSTRGAAPPAEAQREAPVAPGPAQRGAPAVPALRGSATATPAPPATAAGSDRGDKRK